ncbi:MAG: UDP-N-acetylmuramate dehydrogenase [Candidatus Berkelbacteria bacterium]|nr:UDP-N-acetylmuramate dehydrogenase [Candidatus Berkelbacteria bacterium]
MAWQERLKENLNGVKENKVLKKYTTLGVGGISQFLYTAKSIDDLIRTVSIARNCGAPYQIIGAGSNIVVSENQYNGLIICNKSSLINIDNESGRVIADSGASLSRVILDAASNGLGGLETLYGIPGTVGGAVIVNAGAHGVSIAQYLKSASVIISSDKLLSVKGDWFEFGYRTSRLKYKKNDAAPVILNVIFQFQRKKKEEIIKNIAKYKKWREANQPVGERTCGSIFKNPVGTDNAQNNHEQEKTAGYLLDQSGAKKFKVGGAYVSKKHANWVINSGHGTGFEVRHLIEKMRDAVSEKFKIELVEEIEYLGEWNESDWKGKS